MPDEQRYITAGCSISNGIVRTMQAILFKNNTEKLHDFLLSIYRHFQMDYPKFHKMDHLSKLGFLSSELLLKDKLPPEGYRPEQISVVLSNTNASLDADLNYWNSVKNIPSPALFVYTLPNIVIGEICIRNNFKGENAFFVQQDFDAAFMHFYVSSLMDNHNTELSICGWIDVLGPEYKAVLYLVEKKSRVNAVPFTIDNVKNFYELAHG